MPTSNPLAAPLTPGSRLGVYEVSALIGEGGMGAVYRARDTRLKRDVAIKVLLPDVAQDPDRLARFEREAQLLAALNHPHIAAIYGLENVEGREGHEGREGQAGLHGPFLVLEFVDGPTLADRIARGPIPYAEALPIAKQIAEALEAAHEQGIIHRDLKPANIKVKDDGTVKVLDFGLAKAMERAGETGRAGAAATVLPAVPGRPALTASPTITSPALMTGVGVLLGTAAYMSPEQARGRAADKRADIWAFGCVLFEMLTGERAFRGDDITDTLAAIVRDQPDLTKAPSSVRRLLQRCLEKDPKRRLRDLGDVWDLLDADGARQPTSGAHPATTRLRRLAWAGWGIAGSLLVLSAVAFIAPRRSPASSPAADRSGASTWLTATLPAELPLFLGNLHRGIVVTPDGNAIVYLTRDGLAVRTLTSPVATLLPGTSGARAPFVSGDSERVAFINDEGEVLGTSIRGGPTQTLIRRAEVGNGGFLGAAFMPDGDVVFATATSQGLMRGRPDVGQSRRLTSVDDTRSERAHQWPFALPNGRGVLFTTSAGSTSQPVFEVAALDLSSGNVRILVRGSQPEYLDGGYLTFVRDGQLFAAGFDAETLELTAAPTMLVDHVGTVLQGAGYYGVSRTGSLVFLPGPVDINRSLVWLDRAGRETRLPAPRAMYMYPRLSPDGTRVAIDLRENGAPGIALYDLRREALRRLALNDPNPQYPVWHADSQRIFFGSTSRRIQSQSVDGGTAITESSAEASSPLSKTPNDAQLVVGATTDGIRWLGVVTPPQTQVTPLLKSPTAWITNGEVSPGGHFLAFQSSETGREEVFVAPFPDVNRGRWQVSFDGGTRPAWARDGKELFFLNGSGAMMRVPTTLAPTFAGGAPEKLFDGVNALSAFPPGRNYDVAADGRFLMLKDGFLDAPHPLALTVALNWIAEVKAKVGKRP